MTVNTSVSIVEADGDGVTVQFSFSPITVYDANDLTVISVDASEVQTDLVEGNTTTTYSVTLNSTNLPSTGFIRYPATGAALLATGERIIIKRVLPLEQNDDLENQGGYFPDVQEKAFDKLVMIDIQQQEELDRCVKVPIGSTIATDDLIEEILNSSVSADAAAAAASAATASAAAASVDLPTIEADTYLKAASDASGYEAKTAQETVDDLTSNPVTLGDTITYAPFDTIISATTTDLSAATSNLVFVSGTATITSFGSLAEGSHYRVVPTGAWTVTFGSTLIGPSGEVTGSYAINLYQVLDIVSDGTATYCVINGTLYASQSAMEGATNLVYAVTPGRFKYHPLSPKWWCKFDPTATGTNAPTMGSNVTSVTRTSTGRHVINIALTASTSPYWTGLVSCSQRVGTLLCYTGEDWTNAPTATTYSIETVNSGGAVADPKVITVFGFGDL